MEELNPARWVDAHTRSQVLVVDDDRDFRVATGDLLSLHGFECRAAEVADEALEILREGWGDVMVADVRMPGNRNLELFSTVRRDALDTGIIVVTAYPTLESAIQSVNLGISGYLPKPFEPHALITLLRSALTDVAARRRTREVLDGLSALTGGKDPLHACRAAAEATANAPALEKHQLDRVLGFALSALTTATEELRSLLRVSDGDPWGADPPPVQPLSGYAFEHASVLATLSRRERQVLERLLAGRRVSQIAEALSLSEHTIRNHLKSIFGKLGVRSQVELLAKLNYRRRATSA